MTPQSLWNDPEWACHQCVALLCAGYCLANDVNAAPKTTRRHVLKERTGEAEVEENWEETRARGPVGGGVGEGEEKPLS